MYASWKRRLESELEEIRTAGLWKEERVLEGPAGRRIRVRGKEVLCLCANNYLGLANDQELVIRREQ